MPEQAEPLPPSHTPRPHARLLAWSAPAVVAVFTAALLAWTWDKCPELIIDFGREAYVPWRISEGEVLYRDLNYFNGPLAPYVNAMAFEAFGASLRTLKFANASIAVLVALLTYWMVLRIADALAAVIAGATFAVMFAAAHLSGAANFNWLTPYAHDATHGVALSLAMLACLWQAQWRRSLRWMSAAGFAFGLVLLTKVEVGVAATAAAALAIGLMLCDARRGLPRGRLVAAFVAPTLVPPVVAVTLLARAMPLADAARGAAGAWLWLGDTRISGLPYFKWVMGLDDPEKNLVLMLQWTGAYVGLLAASVGLALVFRARSRASVVAAVLAGAGVAVAMELTWWGVKWSGMLRPLPLVLALCVVVGAVRWWSGRDALDRALPRLSLAVLGLALLLKVVLHARAFHYGFALAVPGTLVLVALLVTWAPSAARRFGGAPWVARAVVLGVVLVLLSAHVEASRGWMAQRVAPIGHGPDRFLTDARGWFVDDVMRAIARQREPGDTLVALPEGAMMNFLLRMPSTSRYQNFLPSEMMIYGEQDMLDGLARNPPTFVAILHRVAKEYEPGPQEGGYALGDKGRFGTHYGVAIARWLQANYHPVLLSGEMPFTSDKFGVLLLRRNDRHAPTTTRDNMGS